MLQYKSSFGCPYPLGACPDKFGVNFAVFSEHAEAIELCLFDELGQLETQRIELFKGEGHIWHAYVEVLAAGAKYGYRVHGPYLPEKGLRFNANKLLIDPYARELDRDFCWDKCVFAFDSKNRQKDLILNESDSAVVMPKSVVCERMNAAQIAQVQAIKPYTPWRDTVIYECHVRGFSQLKLDIPADQRGTFAGLAHASSIDYFKSLGITAVELLPVHSFIDEEFLVDQGLSNFWGYNTLNFFCVHHGYLTSGTREEFAVFVKAMHEAGLEVILDVVYNHTAESNQFGPSLSFRGIDNLSYYRLEKSSARYYVNDTGCGNTLRVEHPRVMQLVLDSLRYWAGEMGVDGFRFDLASILGRDESGYSIRAAFFQAVAQDPLLATCKLIAEPWDIGPGGYQLGAFPGQWSEWNDKYRDICRRFWMGERGVMPEFARRIHGSADLFEYAGRGPRASLNFISSHDGFTLRDMVSYRERNNIANQENNRDGHHSNFSDNYGVEGETDDVQINAIRWRQQRNFIATLIFSQGTPMLLGGDELGRTQSGNNNAYCQDNELNWFAWPDLDENSSALQKYTQSCIALRKRFSLLTSLHYLHKPEDLSREHQCARWVSASGEPMNDHDWHSSEHNTLGWILESVNGEARELLLLIFNAHADNIDFRLPVETAIKQWHCLLDTTTVSGEPSSVSLPAASVVAMQGRSLKLVQAVFS